MKSTKKKNRDLALIEYLAKNTTDQAINAICPSDASKLNAYLASENSPVMIKKIKKIK
jgi:hypothetical protein